MVNLQSNEDDEEEDDDDDDDDDVQVTIGEINTSAAPYGYVQSHHQPWLRHLCKQRHVIQGFH